MITVFRAVALAGLCLFLCGCSRQDNLHVENHLRTGIQLIVRLRLPNSTGYDKTIGTVPSHGSLSLPGGAGYNGEAIQFMRYETTDKKSSANIRSANVIVRESRNSVLGYSDWHVVIK